MLIPRKPSKVKSCLDYMKYEEVGHMLIVRLYEQKLTYIGVPRSLYSRLLYAEPPDDIFMSEIFNKYPVVVGNDPKPSRVRKNKRKAAKAAKAK